MKKLLSLVFVCACAPKAPAPAAPAAPADAPAPAESAFTFHGFSAPDRPGSNDTHEFSVDLNTGSCSLIDGDGMRSFQVAGTCHFVGKEGPWLLLSMDGAVTEFDFHGDPAPGEPAPAALNLKVALASLLKPEQQTAWQAERWRRVAEDQQGAGAQPTEAAPALDLTGAVLVERESEGVASPGRAYKP